MDAYIAVSMLFFFSTSGKKGKWCSFISLPIDKISDCFSFKAFADDEINLEKNLKFILGRVENIVGKGENAGYQHFLHFPLFSKVVFLRVVKSWDYVGKS